MKHHNIARDEQDKREMSETRKRAASEKKASERRVREANRTREHKSQWRGREGEHQKKTRCPKVVPFISDLKFFFDFIYANFRM